MQTMHPIITTTSTNSQKIPHNGTIPTMTCTATIQTALTQMHSHWIHPNGTIMTVMVTVTITMVTTPISVYIQAVIQRLTALAVQTLMVTAYPTLMEIGVSMMVLMHSFQTSHNGQMKTVMATATTKTEPHLIPVNMRLELQHSVRITTVQTLNGAT